ncbi:hypothetical protein M422DRAFT_34473 [Sphaerobolus stellatus SS14]|uniref:F-box domain-containing protein n=1 Tax=Sphaerobolus stellatus (strain SS14) TaxID=990650 RepID=A0A0C9UMB8_SPHS4|nr:hypothetical protein M422DRAFT_34473 [Sphaerobolus stellatus SS14]
MMVSLQVLQTHGLLDSTCLLHGNNPGIGVLSDDVLRILFEHTAAEAATAVSTALRLSHTSRRWRHVARHLATLWTRIHDGNGALTSLCVSLSKKADLYVTLTPKCRHASDVAYRMGCEFHRIVRLELDVSFVHLRHIIPLLAFHPAPRLQHCRISSFPVDSPRRRANMDVLTRLFMLPLFGGHSKSLQRVEFARIAPFPDSNVWRNLNSIMLRGLEPMFALDDMITILKRSPQLTELDIFDSIYLPDIFFEESMELPQLESLSIRSCPPDVTSRFLDVVSMPDLQRLHIEPSLVTLNAEFHNILNLASLSRYFLRKITHLSLMDSEECGNADAASTKYPFLIGKSSLDPHVHLTIQLISRSQGIYTQLLSLFPSVETLIVHHPSLMRTWDLSTSTSVTTLRIEKAPNLFILNDIERNGCLPNLQHVMIRGSDIDEGQLELLTSLLGHWKGCELTLEDCPDIHRNFVLPHCKDLDIPVRFTNVDHTEM